MGRLPDVSLAGAPKCGTSSLHAALDRHPQLFMSAVKEPKYFLGDNQPPQPSDGPDDAAHLARYVWRREDYEALFDDAPASSRCGESAPFYLGDPAALERLHKATPGVRLINEGPPPSVRRELMPMFADNIKLTHELTGLAVLEWRNA